ncbi:unnamed protein product [Commensalibacter communis]|uniref:hypothetical protein n=1 Tax=Commensalibacter communis TaxID=2972786 RepID=UPI0022FF7A48|nr:hypothetical protein [Commensalibacter communis]CAI3958308.1 unnamed protein product [Commensalibacter communis]
MSITRPKLYLSKWAENGKRFDVPDSVSDTAMGKANIQTGFPEVTMKSVLNGGVPPWGQDHNGILNRITQDIQWEQAGGMPVFNASLCNKMIGYPLGAELRSTRYPYVSYVNMVEGNLENPDNSTNIDSYWNGTRLGNGWAIKTILSKDPDNISYLDSDFRILTKVAGAQTNLYVRLSDKSNEEQAKKIANGSKEKPFIHPQDAINAIPDGGNGNIYMWHSDIFTLDSWNISRKNVVFYPWFADDDKTITDLQNILVEHIYFFSVYLMKNYPRVQVNINIKKGAVIPNTYDPGLFSGNGGKVEFYGFNFVATQKIPDGFTMNDASPFSPQITYQFVGCIFTNVSYLDYWFNGWQNSITYDIKFDHCLIEGNKNQFINLKNGTVNINTSTDEDWTWVKELTERDIGYLQGNNSRAYLEKRSSYNNFDMKIIGYLNKDQDKPIYYPNGLNTNFDLVFD